ncbi:glutamine--fructose-6-phosphate transaminase (isomerizing) [Alphaproteobacteria bacterium LSUCC0684]
MCGIVGAIGDAEASEALYDALRRLEYRGYDSSGICMHQGERLVRRRAVGKLRALGQLLEKEPVSGSVGIGHTRWATHGGVTLENAHPIMTENDSVAVVHNGIIENFRQLKDELASRGHIFSSETDTEVLCHLFSEAMAEHETLIDATAAVLERIKGAFAFAVLSLAFPGQIAIARNASPLAVGLGDGANYIGSDAIAMGGLAQRVIFLEDGDFGVVSKDHVDIRSADNRPAQRPVVSVPSNPHLVSKEGYQHFMLKEIHEQPDAISHTLASITDNSGHLAMDLGDHAALKGLLLLGAGTSHNAAMIGKYWIESLADLPVVTEIASEFRYRQPSVRHLDLAAGISQSGESLDTLMALRYASEKGVRTLGVINVPESTIYRETDIQLLTHAGPEVGVASTKAFTAQLTVLLGMAVVLGRDRGVLSEQDAAAIEEGLMALPRLVGKALSLMEGVEAHVPMLSRASSCLFLGRGLLYPLALEGALKLKELSYIHAEGYASGEMKHGPIALIEEGMPVIAMMTSGEHLDKSVSNLMEARARGASVITIATEGAASAAAELGPVIPVPDCHPAVAPILLSIPAQMLSYLTAVHKGTDVDQPRNLAKSVTVE